MRDIVEQNTAPEHAVTIGARSSADGFDPVERPGYQPPRSCFLAFRVIARRQRTRPFNAGLSEAPY